MKALRSVGRIVFLAATCASLSVAQEPGRHPAYLHALSDLRDARAHLNQLAPSGKMDREEEHAMREIDAAIQEIRRAAIDDGKDISHHAGRRPLAACRPLSPSPGTARQGAQ
jgi:hypothetical protein